MSYQIITDSCCDLPEQMYEELGLSVVAMCATIDGKTINRFSEEQLKQIYVELRNKAPSSTAAANPQDWEDAILPALEQGQDALCCFHFFSFLLAFIFLTKNVSGEFA